MPGESILEVTDFTIQETSRGFFRFYSRGQQKTFSVPADPRTK